MTTIYDVAARAQVSISTVSRVMNNHPSVSRPIRRVVLEAIAELQFQPNAIARTLRTSRTRTLGLLISNIRNSDVASAAIWGAEAVALEHGYALFVGDSRHDPALELQYLKSLLERRVDGLLCDPMISIEAVADLVQRADVPTVVFGQPDRNCPLPATVLNFKAATEEAIDHLIQLGHRRIGTITHTVDVGLAVNVGWGAQFMHTTLRARGIETNDQFNWVVQSTEDCTRLVHERFTRGQRPTAILVRPLSLVPEAILGIRAAGASVPSDVSIIGFGTAAWTQVLEPPLSVIAADVGAHLDASTRLLISLIKDKHDPLPTTEHYGRYIRRGTVMPPPDQNSLPVLNGEFTVGDSDAASSGTAGRPPDQRPARRRRPARDGHDPLPAARP